MSKIFYSCSLFFLISIVNIGLCFNSVEFLYIGRGIDMIRLLRFIKEARDIGEAIKLVFKMSES